MTRAQDVIIHDRKLSYERKPGRLSGFLREHLGEAAASLAVLGLFYLLMVLGAYMSQNAIDPTASLSWDGRQALVSGPIACALGETFDLRVILTQGELEGAAALSGPCLGNIQRWSLSVPALAGARFVPGLAQVCTVGTLRQQGAVIDRREWCRTVSLVANETGG